jgi:TonB-linked SusC/RagA family outer membrane protein
MKTQKRLLQWLFCTGAALLFSLGILAQQIVSGILRSATGEPLSGATIMVKGTNQSVTTDANGRFSINAPAGSTLIVSYVGYVTQEVAANANAAMNLQLQPTGQEMQQVVVIGYQTVQRKDLTGAVALVNPTQLNRNVASTVAEAMQGLAAGVTVRNTGAPGAGAKIDIRGTGTFGNNNPLYVIDGMLSDATPDFNPNDIESVQILKDASAAAIYGSRAANGVIIITTKKGKEGPLRVGGNIKLGAQEFHKRWNLMNAPEYAALNKQAYINSGLTPQGSVGAELDPNINTDWQALMMLTGSIQDYNLSLSGGNSTATYYVSGEYFKNMGTIIGNSFDRAGVRVNTSGRKGRFSFGENMYLSYSHEDPIEGGFGVAGNVFAGMLSMLPTMPVQGSRYYDPVENPEGWSYGDPAYANTFGTNVYALQKLIQTDNQYYKVRGNAFVEFRLFDWLTYKYNAGLEASFDYSKSGQKPGRFRQGTPYLKPTLTESRSNFLSYLNEHTLNFDKHFGEHHITAVAGISNQIFRTDGLDAQKVGIPAYSGQYYFVPGQSGTPSFGGGIQKWANLGYLGRINYNYADRYLVSATIRRDGDSRFGKNYRWGTFPSLSAAWRIGKEPFFAINGINDLKIRASYGELGNSEILQPWEYLGNISALPRYVFGSNQTITYGATNIQLANPDLRWETKKTANIGLDAAFMNNRITGSVDYFIEKTSDVLVNLPIP